MTADDMADKAGHQAQKVKGKVKEKVGRAAGDRSTEFEGKKDKTAGSLKKAGDNVKDAAKGR
ncbi:MAG TPA: CsbD family protein [Actinocrinis sp.]|nr:CsbD family protein [Actinocrinis sp.]